MKPYLEPTVEFFDLTSVPKAIAELWDEWRELDPGTARLDLPPEKWTPGYAVFRSACSGVM